RAHARAFGGGALLDRPGKHWRTHSSGRQRSLVGVGFRSLAAGQTNAENPLRRRIALAHCWICHRFFLLSPGPGILAVSHQHLLLACQPMAEDMVAALE